MRRKAISEKFTKINPTHILNKDQLTMLFRKVRQELLLSIFMFHFHAILTLPELIFTPVLWQ
jgi:hypothetical protein